MLSFRSIFAEIVEYAASVISLFVQFGGIFRTKMFEFGLWWMLCACAVHGRGFELQAIDSNSSSVDSSHAL